MPGPPAPCLSADVSAEARWAKAEAQSRQGQLDLGDGAVLVEQLQLILDMPAGEVSVLRFISEAAHEGKSVLFVGTKRQAQEAVRAMTPLTYHCRYGYQR